MTRILLGIVLFSHVLLLLVFREQDRCILLVLQYAYACTGGVGLPFLVAVRSDRGRGISGSRAPQEMVRAQSEGKADSARRRPACRLRAPRNSPHSRTHPIYHPYFAAFSHPFSCTGTFAGWSWWRELGIGRRRRWEADLRDWGRGDGNGFLASRCWAPHGRPLQLLDSKA